MAMFPAERKCPVCGKKFLGYDTWVYKRNERMYCSWGCLRKHDRRARVGKTTKRMEESEREEVARRLSRGEKPSEIAEKVGVTLGAIMYYKNKVEA